MRRRDGMSISQTDIDSLLSAADDLAAEADSTLAPDRDTASGGGVQAPQSPSPVRRRTPTEARRILKMRVPVIVKLAECDMPISAILKLTGGSILEFEQVADAELNLLVNNRTVGTGQAVKVGENFGLRITRIHGVEDTIKALGD